MSYEPTTWQSGDIVTAAKLNKMEQALANGVLDNIFYVVITGEYTGEGTYESNCTFSEIVDAYQNGKTIIGVYVVTNNSVIISNNIFANVQILRHAPTAPIFEIKFISTWSSLTVLPPDNNYTVYLTNNIITIDSSNNITFDEQTASFTAQRLQ